MSLDRRPRALVSAAAICLALALGGGVRAAEVYPGCAEPGPTGKVWWVDPVNGKSPADGGDGSQAHPWNSLNAVISAQSWASRGANAGYPRPLLSSIPYPHILDGKRAFVADQRDPSLPDPMIYLGDIPRRFLDDSTALQECLARLASAYAGLDDRFAAPYLDLA